MEFSTPKVGGCAFEALIPAQFPEGRPDQHCCYEVPAYMFVTFEILFARI